MPTDNTKERIFQEVYGRTIDPSPEMIRSMDEYAKAQVLAFAHWYAMTNYYLNACNDPATWDNDTVGESDSITDDQLYNIFIDYITKPNTDTNTQ